MAGVNSHQIPAVSIEDHTVKIYEVMIFVRILGDANSAYNLVDAPNVLQCFLIDEKFIYLRDFFYGLEIAQRLRNNARGVRYHRPKRRIFHSVTLVQISDTNLHRHYEIRYLFQKPPHMLRVDFV